jgi:hypothetical protein
MENNKKELLLITLANKLYREKFLSSGYNVTEISQPVADDFNQINFGKKSEMIALIEVVEDSLISLETCIEKLVKKSVRIVMLSARINENIRKYLFRHGISEVIESNAAGRIVNYIDVTEIDTNKKLGKILVFSDNPQRINILRTITERFNFTAIATSSIDELLEITLEPNVQFILADLGTNGLEIQVLIRKLMTRKNKAIPVIPFKDSYQGLFIHEMISGLNRIAKAILTPEEVYSFLVDILFRKEIIPDLDLLNNVFSADSLQKFSFEPLSKIYNQMGLEIFTMKKIVTNDNINIINGRIESLKNLVTKADGLKWLILSDDIKKPTIGLI